MRQRILAVLIALLPLAAFAEPTITSVSPASAPAAGGTTVTIKGSGFETCVICSPPVPPYVTFGGVPAPSVTIVDPNTLVVTTPAMLPGTVYVTVSQWNGAAALPHSFTFTGEPGWEPVLMPVFAPPVRGVGGSEFVTYVTAANRTDSGPVTYYGEDTSCFLLTPVLGPYHPRIVEAGIGRTQKISPDCVERPARLLYVNPADAARISFDIRVHDISRNASSNGTAIPVVRRHEFTDRPIVLPGVPTAPQFRAMLRIYALREAVVNVRLHGDDVAVTLAPGADPFEPAYVAIPIHQPIYSVPPPEEFFSVSVIPQPTGPGGAPAAPPVPVWAFITITNNVTQEITTITPDLP